MKKLLISTFVVALLTLFTIVVYAHSGRTDSSGGHRDSSTGKYHYHHGYPAHSHYDIDGDGTRDCPYNFNDKTNHNNNSSDNSNTSEKDKEKTKNKITFWDVIKAILLLIPLSLPTLYVLYIVLGLLSIIIEWFIEKCFKISIEESKMHRILYISVIIGLVIFMPIELLCILGIL